MSQEKKKGILFTLGLHRPELRAWAMYDWANSAFITVIITAIYPIYFSEVAVGDETVAVARHGAATTLSILIVALLAPVLGAISDYAACKKTLLGLFMGLGVTGVAAMFFIGEGDWLLAVTLFVLASIGATGSFVFYDALLPHVAREEELDRVSTAGYALGYVGGGLLLAINLAMVMQPGWFGIADTATATRIAFVTVGVWWLVFALPLFFRVSEPPAGITERDESGDNVVIAAFKRLGRTVHHLRQYRNAFLLLMAFLIYSDGIGTIIRMATIYGTEIGIGREAMITAVLVTQFVGIPFAFMFGSLAGWIGTKPAIFLGLAIYVCIALLGYYMTTATHFLLLAGLVGMVQGGTQGLSRSLFASLIPRHKSGEFFGFFGIMDKFAGSIGSGVITLLALAAVPTRFGVLTIAGFFIIGAILLYFVDVKEGQRIARAAEPPGKDEVP